MTTLDALTERRPELAAAAQAIAAANPGLAEPGPVGGEQAAAAEMRQG